MNREQQKQIIRKFKKIWGKDFLSKMRKRDEVEQYLKPTPIIDCDHETVKEKASDVTKREERIIEKAISLFYFVRDEIRFALEEHSPASETLKRGTGQCVTKSSLQIALLRAAGIPARYHLVDLISDCLKGIISQEAYEGFGGVITDHPWCECHLSNKWISCDTLFDEPLYEAGLRKGVISKADIPTIDWDGENDVNTMTTWIVKDKGRSPNRDDRWDNERKEMGSLWPILRESNKFTEQLRKE